MRTAISMMVLWLTLSGAPARSDSPAADESSVVRIVNYAQRGNWYAPWNVLNVQESMGSGFVIEGGLVVTNAHVVSDSRLLLIFLHNDPEPHEAVVHVVAHDCDLALVRPLEPGLLDRVPALEIGPLPELGSTVVTLGYPVGGSRVSSTRGVVSRIESQLYLHSGIDWHRAVQTDAAINPGNSGGPVIQNGKAVGVAFQAAADLQSIGYFIPDEVIDRFLRDVRDGDYDGYPELGVQTSGLENPAARRRVGLADGETGVRVDAIYGKSSAAGLLAEGDVILEVDGHTVANDGTVQEGAERFGFGMLVDRHLIGESVTLRVLRDGRRIDLSVELRGYSFVDKRANLYDRLPRYFVYGGLVFVPLDLEMIKTFGSEWVSRGDKAVLHEFMVRPFENLDLFTQDRVVLLRRLKHPVNAEMAWYRNQVIDRVNGREIRSLDELIEAIESHDGDYQFFEFSSYRRFGVLDRRAAERANAEILERYGVPRDRNR